LTIQAPRRPGAADAALPCPNRAERALLVQMGLLAPEHRGSRADSAASAAAGGHHQNGDGGGAAAVASTRSTRRRSSRSAAAQTHHAALDSATDDLELGGRGAQAVATTELTESGYEDPSLHGDASVAHRLE